MKSSVAIALIISGTVLILVPLIHSAITTGMAAWATAMLAKDVNLTAGLPRYYYVACMIAGVAMILVGTLSALKSKTH